MTEHEAGAPTRPFRRGVVEGFYGPPWSHGERLWMIDLIASLGMNHYIYAPKDDPFHRERWRDPYDGNAIKRFGRLADHCAASAVTFNFALSPGLSIVYADRGDRQKLVDKYLSLAARGVRAFSLFLDDIPPGLREEADKNAFGEFAHAHADLANDLRHTLAREIGAEVELLFCPTEYAGMEPSAYLETLGRELDRRIAVFWTGPQVVSPTIGRADARAFGALIGRKPYLWDNYPVNDFAPNRLFVGPLCNREGGLEKELAGFAANPMNQVRASQVALRTLAAWFNDSVGYVPDAAWETALDETFHEAAGAGASRAMKNAFKTVAHLFAPSRLVEETQTPLSVASGAERVSLAGQLGAAAERLLDAAGEIELFREIAGWLRDIVLRCRTVRAAHEADGAAREGDPHRARQIAAAAWADRMLVGRRHRLSSDDEMNWADARLVPLLREAGDLIFDAPTAPTAKVIDAGEEIGASKVIALHAKPWMKPPPRSIPRLWLSTDGQTFEPLPVDEEEGLAVARPGSQTFRYIKIDTGRAAAESCGVYLLIHVDRSPRKEPTP